MKTNEEYLDDMHFLDKNGNRLPKMEWMEWIDIEQEKPLHRQEVFVNGKFPFETKCTYLETPNGYTFVTSGLKSGIYEIYGITHWMPLPISKK